MARNGNRLPRNKKNKNEKVKIIPLGGLGEIGRNMTAIEYEDEILVIDCGLGFPDESITGIDLIKGNGFFKTVFDELAFDDTEREQCSVNRDVQQAKHIGQGTDVVFMSMC